MFTFKKQPKAKGLASIGSPNANTIIKLKKKQVGTITGPNWQTEDHLWTVRLAVKKENAWEWIALKERFATEPEARTFLNEYHERIMKLNLYQFEDDE